MSHKAKVRVQAGRGYARKRRLPTVHRFGHEELESRLALNATPVSVDDGYVMNQNTTLKVTDVAAVPNDGPYSGLQKTDSLALSFTPNKIEYSAAHRLLVLREGNSKLHVIDVTTGLEVSSQLALESFTDFDLTSDGNFLYAADFGGESVYGDPVRPNWVHRFDLAARTWEVKEAPQIAYRVEAVDAERFLALEKDQWVELTLNSFKAGTAAPIVELYRISSDYSGDIEFDSLTGRVYHGNSGSSSHEINAYSLDGNQLIAEGDTGVYGTAQGGGFSTTLSTNGEYFYYGKLQVTAANIQHNVRMLPESIIAGTTGLAFSNTSYYSEQTGALLGSLPYTLQAIGVSDTSTEVWMASTNLVEGFRIPSYGAGVLANDVDADSDLLTAVLEVGPSHGTVDLLPNGSFIYTPIAGFVGEDTFTYRADDGQQASGLATVTIVVQATGPSGNTAPIASDDRYTTTQNTPLDLADPSIYAYVPPGTTYPGLQKLQSLDLENTASQLEFSVQYHLLFVREGTGRIRVFDTQTQAEINSELPIEKFTDFDLTSDGHLFAADYGGEVTGYGTPARPHWVHRFDAETQTWQVKQAPRIGYQIEAIDDERFLLKEGDQWVDITLNDFHADTAAPISELSRSAAGYSGDMEYNDTLSRAYHGSSGSSSREIESLIVSGNALLPGIGTGTYGTAQNGGGSLTVSTDGKYLFYGVLQVDAADIVTNLHSYSNAIIASTGELAFSTSKVFDPRSTNVVGTIPFASPAFAPAADGSSIWAFEPSTNELHQYAIRLYGRGILTNDQDLQVDPLILAHASDPRHGSIQLNADGTFVYTPQSNFRGVDWFTYKTTDGSLNSNSAQVVIGVSDRAPVATGEDYTVEFGEPLIVDANLGLLANDDDPDGDELLVELLSQPSNGQVTVNPDGSFTYMSNAGFDGDDAFTYRITDRYLSSTVATATIHVQPPVMLLNHVPGAQRALDNTELVFSTAKQNSIAIEIADPSLSVEVHLQLDQGTLQLGDLSGLTSVNGNSTHSVVIAGEIAGVNAALANLKLVPPTDFVGFAVLQVSSTTQASDGESFSDTDTVSIEFYEAPFHNRDIPEDVSGNGDVEPLDVLIAVDDINRNGIRQLTSPTNSLSSLAVEPTYFFDVNADNRFSPLDILMVIDKINRQSLAATGGLLAESTSSQQPDIAIALGVALSEQDAFGENAAHAFDDSSMGSIVAPPQTEPAVLSFEPVINAGALIPLLREHSSPHSTDADFSIVDELFVSCDFIDLAISEELAL